MATADPGAGRPSGGARPGRRVAALGEVRLRSVLDDGGRSWPALSWQAPSGPDPAPSGGTAPGWRGVSSSLTGGGLGPVDAWINVMVDKDYAEPDPVGHVHDLAAQLGMRGRVAGMITAADVRAVQQAEDGGVHVAATVGLGVPTLAAAPDGAEDAGGVAGDVLPVGTINILVRVPVPMSDAALVNLVMTVTEAKAQALAEAGFEATGTASDAVCVVCPEAHEAGESAPVGVEPFGGPRSRWGARTARAVHRAVLTGAFEWRAARASRSH